jgi:hypothetical protein
MSRNKQKIKKLVEEKGYEVEYIEWSPLGGNVEMQGPEGGWVIELWRDDVGHQYIPAMNMQQVLEQIGYLP